MATSMKKTTTKKMVENITPEIVEEKEIKEVSNITDTKKKTDNTKKYDSEELIACKSITNGKLLVDGEKSGRLYRWSDYGDIEYIEYRDLIYMVTARRSWIFKPRFIILDSDFVKQNTLLNDLYRQLYKISDLKEILNLPIKEMTEEISTLPDGAYESIQNIAASMISNGQLDSVKKIRALDEIFETSLLLQLVQE